MAIPVYLEKRLLKAKKRNGQRTYVWRMRWQEGAEFRAESTRTADKTQAEELRKAKWAELNIPGAAPVPEPEPEPERPKIGWQDCKEALERAMTADNLRPSYIRDALLTLEGLRRMFPELATPGDVTADVANEYKRRRAEEGKSPWSIRGDLATLKAVFGKWLGKECGLLDHAANPFADVKAPRCDDPEVRIVSADETASLFGWLGERWNNWRLPLVYLEVAALLGWRATELASIREEDFLGDGHVRVLAESSKTRKHKYGWLPASLYADLQACAAGGYAFGRFADELRRLMILWRKQPHHAARVQDFAPKRLVGWLQDELQRFNEEQAERVEQARNEGPPGGRQSPGCKWPASVKKRRRSWSVARPKLCESTTKSWTAWPSLADRWNGDLPPAAPSNLPGLYPPSTLGLYPRPLTPAKIRRKLM
ncbi:MAG: hypothetical protein B7Z73_05505 [Planctomycetia bacterium 21-64-5]|nr:MAG: hypothetical protein B7Z73_05505 [Planctomycetia bacterium 21-64-5]